MQAAAAAPAAAAIRKGLLDNYDDAEGYYNFQVGEVVADKFEVRLTLGLCCAGGHVWRQAPLQGLGSNKPRSYGTTAQAAARCGLKGCSPLCPLSPLTAESELLPVAASLI